MAQGWAEPSGGSGGGGAYILTDKAGADNFFEKARQSLVALSHYNDPFGGSREFSIAGTGWQNAPEWVEWVLPSADYAGFIWTVRLEVKTADAGTSIQGRVWNETDSVAAITGAAITATSFTKDPLVFTPIVGKSYLLQLQKGDDNAPAWGFATLERSVA